MKNICVLLCNLLLIAVASAADIFSIEHTINSKHPEQERKFTVHLPKSYHSPQAFSYPVMFLLDGESNLDYAQTVSSFLAENGQMPEIIIVALHAGLTRERDYLPNNTQDDAGLTGDADQFLRYIRQELIPYIESEYRAAPLRLLSGHSIGGAFVIYSLLEQPELFQGYMAQSPYIDQSLLNLYAKHLKALSQKQTELDKVLYINLGEEPDLESVFNGLQESLKANAVQGFDWQAVRAPGETHMTTRLLGQYHGLQAFFSKDWPLSQVQIATGKGKGLKAHIDGLSKKYDYPVLYSEQTLAQAAQVFLSQGDVESGIESANIYTSQYPTSPLAHFFLANGLALKGDAPAAAEAASAAVKLYDENPKPALAPLYPAMKQLEQQLNAVNQ